MYDIRLIALNRYNIRVLLPSKYSTHVHPSCVMLLTVSGQRAYETQAVINMQRLVARVLKEWNGNPLARQM